MKYRKPLKRILTQTRAYWDRDETRPGVRDAFRKALLCGTPALGAEVYASENQEKVVCHTCKGKGCPSCGYRATVTWQRQRWAALPDIPYKGITFTMPDVLWEILRDNAELAGVLPVLASSVIQAYARARHGLHVGVIAVLHTFNGRLEFNSHVHTMITSGGLQSSGRWVSSSYYDKDVIMQSWRRAVIRLLRAALRTGRLRVDVTTAESEAMLNEQGKRWWSVNVQSLGSKEHFLKYAGRYVRRPPIAQRRITYIGERSIEFWTLDKKLGCRVSVRCSPEEFIDRWSQHIPDPYTHSVRYFGLFAPRSLSQTSATVFALNRQKQSPRPKARPWAESLERDFGTNPLLDRMGEKMKWVRRLRPQQSRSA